MVIKVVKIDYGHIVHYASGRTHIFYDNRKLPNTVKLFKENHTPTIEKYGNTVNATVWK